MSKIEEWLKHQEALEKMRPDAYILEGSGSTPCLSCRPDYIRKSGGVLEPALTIGSTTITIEQALKFADWLREVAS